MINKCEFHADDCEEGIDGLAAWEFKYNEETGVFSREPNHNWASHPSDAFAYGCQVMQDVKLAPIADNTIRGIMVGANTVTINELWNEQPKGRARI